MVSAITPSTIGALAPNAGASTAGGTNANSAEAKARETSALEDIVSAQGAPWSAARDSVRQALADIDLSLAAGRDAGAIIARIGEAARSRDDAGLKSLLSQLDELVQGAVASGATALTGATVRAEIEPDAPAFEVTGVDLRLQDDSDDELSRTTNASSDEAAAKAAAAAQDALTRLDATLARLQAASARLQAHDGFLTALQANVSANVKSDIDADAARLLALNVRQGLSQSDAAIANAHSDSVLALFRG